MASSNYNESYNIYVDPHPEKKQFVLRNGKNATVGSIEPKNTDKGVVYEAKDVTGKVVAKGKNFSKVKETVTRTWEVKKALVQAYFGDRERLILQEIEKSQGKEITKGK